MPDDDEVGMEPDTQPGAWIGCECSACVEARLRDDEFMRYTAHDLAAAWQAGWLAGKERAQ